MAFTRVDDVAMCCWAVAVLVALVQFRAVVDATTFLMLLSLSFLYFRFNVIKCNRVGAGNARGAGADASAGASAGAGGAGVGGAGASAGTGGAGGASGASACAGAGGINKYVNFFL